MSNCIKHPLENRSETLFLAAREAVEQCSGDAAKAALRLKSHFKEEASDSIETALELALGELKARSLGISWPNIQVTRLGLEQSSKPPISEHHAKRFGGLNHVLEIGTGLGLDTIALAKSCKQVTTIERDEAAAKRAKHNFEQLGLTNITVLCGEAESVITPSLLETINGIWADPSRRSDRQSRAKSPEDYSPKLSWLLELGAQQICGIKISPAVDVSELLHQHPTWWQEYVGGIDDCREQILWHDGKRDNSKTFVSIPESNLEISLSSEQQGLVALEPEELTGGYVYELHSALYAAHVASSFAVEHGLSPLGSEQGYYGSLEPISASGWIKGFKILSVLPLRPAQLKTEIAKLGWNSRTEIKKRGVDESPEERRKELKLPSPSETNQKYGVVLCFSPDKRKKLAILAERLND